MKINTVTVIGANGALGIGVASIFASFGNAKVYMIARTLEKSNKAIEKVGDSVRAHSVCENLEPKTYKGIKECIERSDLIIETVVEDLNIKKKIHSEINKYKKSIAISSSVTSGISINELSKCYSKANKGNFFGIHFFNPPYNLQLCELIASNDSNKMIERELKGYLESNLYRKVIRVKDTPGFLANRIGFQFINKAMQYAEKYKDEGGIDYIDNILGCFTGRNMPPLYTANFVGLDVHKAIVDNIYLNTKDFANHTFKLPDFVNELINDGRLGEKSKEGLYKDNNDFVWDIADNKYRRVNFYKINFIDAVIENLKIGDYRNAINIILKDKSKEANICRDMLIDYILYSYEIVKKVGYNLLDCDTAMAEGFNWIPPFSLLNLIEKNNFKKEAIIKYKDCKKIIEEICNNDIISKYRYEKFLKAKR